MKQRFFFLACGLALLASGCMPDDVRSKFPAGRESDAKYVGQAVGNFTAEEWYPGGVLGTTDNVTEGCYEDETPATAQQGLMTAFNLGEAAFERNFTLNTAPFKGLGPAYLRTSCLDCHPGYGHGKRQQWYKAGFGNGYLLVIYHPVDGANSDDGPYVAEVTGMPQTKAVEPFLPPVDEDKISLNWLTVSAMESGLPMAFPDGEKYELIYPELSIPRDGFNTDPTPYETGNQAVAFRLESTIGIIGTGLLDAIPEEDIKAQYQAEAPFVELNPAFWDKDANDFAPTAWYSLAAGQFADGTPEGIADAVLNLLDPTTNQFDNAWHNFTPEMGDDQYYNFLVWHRGLSIPRARDLNREDVQRGKEVFTKIGCASCHRPSWKTKSDNYWAPAVVDGKPLPRYENQTIWPYTDMIQHRLYMKNGIHGSWCRTTPLWGRGLSKANTGAEDRLHDDRARNVIEAIMWHGYSKKSDAYDATEKFYYLSPEDRKAVVAFIDAI